MPIHAIRLYDHSKPINSKSINSKPMMDQDLGHLAMLARSSLQDCQKPVSSEPGVQILQCFSFSKLSCSFTFYQCHRHYDQLL